MKQPLITFLLLCIGTSLFGQTIKGKVVDENTSQPLEYASIGIVNTRYGTISNAKGFILRLVTFCMSFYTKSAGGTR